MANEAAASEAGCGTEFVLEELLGRHVLLVTLNRPAKLNAVNTEMAIAIRQIVERSEADPEIRAVLLASSGARAFCAGADIATINVETVSEDVKTQAAKGGFAGFVNVPRLKPWIAIVEGLAFGGGCEVCLACDMIVASENASFALPEVKRSFVAGAGGVHRLHQVLPRNIALELIATGNPIDATRAHGWGMVNRLTPPGQALAEARALAEEIAAAAPIAVQYSLAAARATLNTTEEESALIVAHSAAHVRSTEDYREGIRAFLEKRPAVWASR